MTYRLCRRCAVPEFGAFWLLRPWLSATPRGDGHPVLVLPGLLADDSSTRPLRSFLNSHGYRAHGWKQGRNLGLRGSLERDMLARIDELFERYDRRKISLVGWSLGGLYARQLAKLAPDKVRCMISLGSPFAGSPKSTNAWRAYEKVSGSKVDDQELTNDTLADAPPVPTTSIFSRSDGICAWQTCLNDRTPGEREHRSLWQPLRPRPSSGGGLRHRRPPRPARRPLAEIRSQRLARPGFSGLATRLGCSGGRAWRRKAPAFFSTVATTASLVLLVHPGGPFWRRATSALRSIPRRVRRR